MAATQTYVIGWLVRRLEWEDTLAELHARAAIARASDAAARVAVDAPAQGLRPCGAAEKLRSPVRGMSRLSFLLRIRP